MKGEITVIIKGQTVKLPVYSGLYQDILKASLPTSASSIWSKIFG